MSLPIEIISEIANQNPFNSFMRYLNKETKKYWEMRFLNLDTYDPTKCSLKIQPELVYISIETEDDKKISILARSKFIVMDKDFVLFVDANNSYREIIREGSVRMIDLRGQSLIGYYLDTKKGPTFCNYEISVYHDTPNLEEDFPDYPDLINEYRTNHRYDDRSIADCRFVWNLYIVKGNIHSEEIPFAFLTREIILGRFDVVYYASHIKIIGSIDFNEFTEILTAIAEIGNITCCRIVTPYCGLNTNRELVYENLQEHLRNFRAKFGEIPGLEIKILKPD